MITHAIANDLLASNRVIDLFIGSGKHGIPQRIVADYKCHPTWTTKISVNETFLGWCDARDITSFLVNERLSWPIPYFLSFVTIDNWLYISIDLPIVITDSLNQLPIYTCEYKEL